MIMIDRRPNVRVGMRGDFSMTSDADYYRERARVERDRAAESDRTDVAEIHLELARLYDAMVEQPALRSRTLSLWPGNS